MTFHQKIVFSFLIYQRLKSPPVFALRFEADVLPVSTEMGPYAVLTKTDLFSL